ncbi:MAG: methyltransferase domain-containing protein [Proteobacteria bacterium]|nr:methyltransferase domain-containing protein [Pseudomonadota bacterium]
MSIENIQVVDAKALAVQIQVTSGVCRALVVGKNTETVRRELWQSGFDVASYDLAIFECDSAFSFPFSDESFDTVVVFGGIEFSTGIKLSVVLAEIKRVTRRSLILFADPTKLHGGSFSNRRDWELHCFEAGFRKHPLYYRTNDYASLESNSDRIFIPLEKVPMHAWERYPMASLRKERDLHMDMLRESGSRSDAHVGRYHFAAGFIRPGDAVLDAACGLGYGTYVVRSETQARSFIGIDASEYGIDYARLNFGGEATSFLQGMLPDCLVNIPDNSVDHILCFETLEHVEDPIRLLAEFQRVLTPGGRLTCSVPHDWSDETGEDPNPFHFHVYDKKRFVGELAEYFDLEHLMAQTADRVKQPGGGCNWLKRPRSLTNIAVNQEDIEAEWLLAVAAKSPLNGSRVPYSEQVFSSDEMHEAGNALAFARDYSNPWLIRAMISIGLRTENEKLRKHWAEAVWTDPVAGVVDRGAALCVLAYIALAGNDETSEGELRGRIYSFLAKVTDDSYPTVLRWRVSLMYVGGLLELSRGRREAARRFFADVIAAPVAMYSATLHTKSAEAAYLLGLLLAAEGRNAEAQRTWWDAFQQISTGLGKRLTQGYHFRPAVFEIRELAAALALCGRLVAAAAHGAGQDQRSGVFYDQCHADSAYTLSELRKNFFNQQVGLEELQRGKNWLETQWRGSNVELDRLRQTLAVQEAGKGWLEKVWKAGQEALSHKTVELETVLEGKDWLEHQWTALLEQIRVKDKELKALQVGKDWLESQWKTQTIELDNQRKCIEAQRSKLIEFEARFASADVKASAALPEIDASLVAELEVAKGKMAQLERSLLFRVCKKLGFF